MNLSTGKRGKLEWTLNPIFHPVIGDVLPHDVLISRDAKGANIIVFVKKRFYILKPVHWPMLKEVKSKSFMTTYVI